MGTGRLDHVLWIGGVSGSGKSSVAARLARRRGLRLYGADTRTWEHRDRALATGNEAAHRFEDLGPRGRWRVPDADLLAMSLHRERGAMVVDDLGGLPPAPLVVAEGTTLPAGRAPRDPARAVWLLATPDFHAAQLAARGTTGGRARLFLRLAEHIRAEAAAAGVPRLEVDGTEGVDAVTAAVEARFAPTLDAGPVAATRSERRALLREANLAVVAQVHGFHGRPWAEGDADVVVRRFACECARPACSAEADVLVGAAAAGAVLAPGHA